MLQSYKHSTEPCRVVIAACASSPHCPVRAIMEYCQMRGSYKGPLFTLGPASVFSADISCQYLRRTLNFCVVGQEGWSLGSISQCKMTAKIITMESWRLF